MSPSTASTPRTCRPGGVTGTGSRPGTAMTRRRVSCSSRVHTIRPSAVQAGTPGTISSQCGSVSSCSTLVWPVPACREQDPHGALVPALHHDERVVPVLPVGGDQVGEGGRVGLHRYGGAVEPGQEQGHIGVRGAGRGVGHLGGRAFRVSGIGDVPPGDGGLVDPRDEQGGAVRGPPVTAMAVHLLGRDELGQPERHPRRALRVRERAVFAAVGRLGLGVGPLGPLGPARSPAARRRRRRPAAVRPGRAGDPGPGCAWPPRGARRPALRRSAAPSTRGRTARRRPP